MSKNIQLGIDIGSSKIALSLGYFSEEGVWNVIAFEKTQSSGVLRGEIVDSEKVSFCIKRLLKQIKGKAKDVPNEVNVALGGQYIENVKTSDSLDKDKIIEFKKEDVELLRKNCSSVVTEQGREVLFAENMGFEIDRSKMRVETPVGSFGRRLVYYCNVVLGNVNCYTKIKQCMESCGLKVKGIYLNPVVTSKLVLTDDERRRGSVFVDIGAGTTNIAVYYGGILRHVSIIPFGGESITYDISRRYKLSVRDAEILKLTSANAFVRFSSDIEKKALGIKNKGEDLVYNPRDLDYVVQCRLEEILDAVNYQILKYKDKIGAGIILCGGTSLLPYIKELTNAKLDKDVRLGYPLESLINYKDIYKDLSCSTAMGLMISRSNESKGKSGFKNKLTRIFS